MGHAAAQVGLTSALAPLAAAAGHAIAELRRLAPPGALADVSATDLLHERAMLTGRTAGSCRLLEAADGWVALNLARPEDWELLPAWLEADGPFEWQSLAAAVRTRHADTLVGRGRLLGLAVAPDVPPEPAEWCSVTHPRSAGSRHAIPRRDAPRDDTRPLVIDLSSLWAGPLCGHLLQRLGAQVIKVESTQRPDGARRGPSTFFDLLNAGKASVALDLHTPPGRAALRGLLERADIVIEASRPRALRQMGIVAEELVVTRGLTWISITGYGRGAPAEDWVAYGDDAAVAAGLSHVAYVLTGRRTIVGDAVADPLTGIHAALAAWTAHRAGGGRLVALALRDVVRHALTENWDQTAISGEKDEPGPCFSRRALRRAAGLARPLGADTAAVLTRFGIAA